MEYDTIIVSLLGESNKVLYSLRSCRWEEFESDISEGCGEEDLRIGHDYYKKVSLRN
jgi:hypothetical protein